MTTIDRTPDTDAAHAATGSATPLERAAYWENAARKAYDAWQAARTARQTAQDNVQRGIFVRDHVVTDDDRAAVERTSAAVDRWKAEYDRCIGERDNAIAELGPLADRIRER